MDLQSILLATDFSECACSAFQTAKKLGRPFRAKIILLHVINERRVAILADHMKVAPETLIPELRERANEQLQSFIKYCDPETLQIESMVTVGVPFQQISVLARDLAVDLVVLGGHGNRGQAPLEEVFFGSTAEKVVRLLPCPVLCVPLGKE
ncbi:MAG: universal stress protein [Thermodesulfobacteriota bacterium]